MAEWLKAHAWKACVRETVPWVRIPLSPPQIIEIIIEFGFLCVAPIAQPINCFVLDGEAPQMKKLLNLKKWLTVADAARHLGILFGEDVSEADVLRLALDGHLTLSVYFVNGARGRCGPAVRAEDSKCTIPEENLDDGTLLIVRPSDHEIKVFWYSPDDPRVDSRLREDAPEAGRHDDGWTHLTGSPWEHEGDGEPKVLSYSLHGLPLGDGRVLECARATARLDGVWDLTMLGHERLEIEQRYQFLTEGPEVDMSFQDSPLDHPIVSREDGTFCQLHEPRDASKYYYPAGGLPADSVLVVRTSALHDFEARISAPDQRTEKPLERRERTTLLVMIAALAELAKIDVAKPSGAAVAIESQTVRMGARVAARTIENHLKFIPDALEGRSG
jgi:hypothetical protein